MRALLPAMFSLVVAAAGWYYMFYSRAAHNLSGVETDARNLRRIRLRRVGGFMMFLLAVAFFAGFQPYVWKNDVAALGVWTLVMFLLLAIVVLGLIDLRLTWQLRKPRDPKP
jgi:UDP-N-acetylmuramyl pentapeptide phosphotransferase/UDP-N-acetylglucosamine-1-phosphate transferase